MTHPTPTERKPHEPAPHPRLHRRLRRPPRPGPPPAPPGPPRRPRGPPPLPQGPPLLFIGVPEPKTLKNRLHLDLEAAPGSTRDTEVERLLALGATLLHDLRGGRSTDWAVLADPEGNEFCVGRADHEP
ncbi:VOC family protein [Nocardiopsis sp. CT-R113]|uniref:VOC family protein n=1 Tax=Nocardiopsis codii TaxID=3065942 RepID=A0ABU7KDJ6_9ACTN|nr:VOC family protein [Nocardiopsis sp. CT-R113]MEE2040313.1 VOC family protein [Nocardiopsis sp. CT-R113]